MYGDDVQFLCDRLFLPLVHVQNVMTVTSHLRLVHIPNVMCVTPWAIYTVLGEALIKTFVVFIDFYI